MFYLLTPRIENVYLPYSEFKKLEILYGYFSDVYDTCPTILGANPCQITYFTSEWGFFCVIYAS